MTTELTRMEIELKMSRTAYDEARAIVGTKLCDTITEALRDVEIELIFAMSKFGKFNSPHEGYAVILEELDEMWDDIKSNELAGSRAEAVQVAAMAVRYLIDTRNGLDHA